MNYEYHIHEKAIACLTGGSANLFLDVLRNVFLDAELLHSFLGDFDGLLLQLFGLPQCATLVSNILVGTCLRVEGVWLARTMSTDLI